MPVVNELPTQGGGAKKWIYKHGTEYYGGLVVGFNTGVVPTRTKYADHYHMSGTGSSSQGSNGSSVTDQKVDLTGYSKVGVLLSNLTLGGSYSAFMLLITSNKTDGNSQAIKTIGTGVMRGYNTPTLNNVRLEYDISDLNGEYYVAIYCSSAISASWSFDMTELYLIK